MRHASDRMREVGAGVGADPSNSFTTCTAVPWYNYCAATCMNSRCTLYCTCSVYIRGRFVIVEALRKLGQFQNVITIFNQSI